jgi:hypothetical protein
MPLTVGSNSYINREDADAYFADITTSPAWDSADDAAKDGALVQATRRIDRLDFVGTKADPAQLLQFPRCYPVGVYADLDPVDLLPDEGLLASTRDRTEYECEEEVPTQVLDAVCEEAAAILAGASSPQADMRSRLQRQGVTSARIGSAAETYDGTGRKQMLRSLEAYDLLDEYMASGGAFG